jgi:hypothetical protein
MRIVHMIPLDDISENHSICKCSCSPLVKTDFVDGQMETKVIHKYKDGKPYIKSVCADVGIKTPNFKYANIVYKKIF